MDLQEVCQVGKDSPERNSRSEEANYQGLTELKSDSKEIHTKLPIILDAKQNLYSQKCTENYSSPSKDSLPYSIVPAEVSYDSLRIFCRTSSLLKIPTNIMSLDFIIKNLRHHRKKQSIDNPGDFAFESSPAARTGNVVTGPSGRWIFDSTEAAVEVRMPPKRSTLFLSGPLDCSMRQVKSRSLSSRLVYAEMVMSPFDICNTVSCIPKARVIPLGERISEFGSSGKMFAACSSTASRCSYQSTSSTHHFVSTGILRCIWKNGCPSFEFSLENDQSAFYMANPLKIKSSVGEGPEYIYLFHAKTYGRKDFGNQVSSSPKFVGRMKVSSSLVLNPDGLDFIETEFVMSASDRDSEEMKRPPCHMKHKGLAQKVAEVLRPSHSSRQKDSYKVESCSQLENVHEVIGESSNIDELGGEDFVDDDYPPNFESVAIVVQNYQDNNIKGSGFGGWGLKFLKKYEVTHLDVSLDPSSSTEGCEERCMQNKSARVMNIIIPRGIHGGPISKTGGPSSLTDRWRSHGLCDCGGWDIGCPITVLRNSSISSECFPHMQLEDSNSVDLFMEGSKNGDPEFRLVNESKGLYLIYFHSTLSALQCFSVGVAIIHSQKSDLYPKM
ncbi:uncharacterized protein [Typha angustifolia]|uniref:uncharacterized protein n=1 Tax=Typha angustifolia TaxID=59011 RepID=UPI003C2D928C